MTLTHWRDSKQCHILIVGVQIPGESLEKIFLINQFRTCFDEWRPPIIVVGEWWASFPMLCFPLKGARIQMARIS